MTRAPTFSLVLLSAGAIATPQMAQGQIPDSTVIRLMAEHSVPGLALAVVQGGSTHLYGWGNASADAAELVTPDTPFRIASVAKVLVAATVLTAAQNGAVDLQADVEPLVGFPLTGAHNDPVRVHHLLTHTAGFDERMVGYAARESRSMRPLGEYLSERMPSRGWPPGEVVSYSNHGMSLAAYAVERAVGEPFGQVAEASLFAPLGMDSTRFIEPGMEIPTSAARALSCDEADCEARAHVFSNAYPAGLAFSTARDMGRFIAAFLGEHNTGEGLAKMVPERFTHDPRIPGMSYGFFNQFHDRRRVLAHSGSAGGYWALLLIVPEEETGFFFAANGGDSGFGRVFRDRLLTSLLGRTPATLRPPRRAEDPAMRAGYYELTRYSHGTIERLPQLFYNSIRLAASGDTLLVYAGGGTGRFLQVDDSLYQAVDSEELLAFGTRGGRVYLFRSSEVYGAHLPAAYERRHKLSGSYFLNEYLSWLLAVPLVVMSLLWPGAAGVGAYRRKRRKEEAPEFNPLRLTTTILTTVALALFTWFVGGFTARSVRLLETGEMLFGMPESLSKLVWIPYVHVALTGLLVLMLPVVWKRRWWNRFLRIVSGVMVVALLLQVHFFLTWNYLPATW